MIKREASPAVLLKVEQISSNITPNSRQAVFGKNSLGHIDFTFKMRENSPNDMIVNISKPEPILHPHLQDAVYT